MARQKIVALLIALSAILVGLFWAAPNTAFAATTGTDMSFIFNSGYRDLDGVDHDWSESALTVDGSRVWCGQIHEHWGSGISVSAEDPVASGWMTQEQATHLALMHKYIVEDKNWRLGNPEYDDGNGGFATSDYDSYATFQIYAWAFMKDNSLKGAPDVMWFYGRASGDRSISSAQGESEMGAWIAENKDNYIGHIVWYDAGDHQDGFTCWLEEAYGGIGIEKIDADTTDGDPQGAGDLTGAEFQVINGDGEVVDTLTITKQSDGSYKAESELRAYRKGDYTIHESKLPPGYSEEDRAPDQPVTVVPNQITWCQAPFPNVIKRGDLTLTKFDENLKRSEAQGDADLSNIHFDIINMSEKKVVSPEDGTTEIAPGKVVCRITTKKDGDVYKASTKYTNTNQKSSGSGKWNTPNDWRGALAAGDYKVVEVGAGDGSNANDSYKLGIWKGDNKTVWEATFSIDTNGQIVNFNAQNKAPNDTVKRGDIELIKYDDQLKRSEAQGDADLEGIQFAIINRSKGPVISPEDGTTEIPSGKEVCRITTKKVTENGKTVYKASTKATGVNSKRSGSGTWNTPSDWHGALAYGSYQIVELSPDGKYVGTGYLFGAWTGNNQKIWHGNAAGSKWANNWMNISGSDVITGNTFTYTTSNGQKFDPDTSSHKWIDDDKITVTFDDKDHGPNNTVQRGDIELIKADDNWNESALQGNADLAGAVFEIHNASKGVVVSPQTGQEVEPGGLVCTITTFKDENGKYKATTYCPAGSLAATANGWSIPASYAYPDGTCGHALPYGQYVVTEKTPPNGYMLNTEWIGRAINDNDVHTNINFSVSNGNKFTLAGKTSNASATPTWINEQGVLVKFDNKKANENKPSQEHYHNGDAVPQAGASLDTVDRVDETWCEDTIFRAGIRIGKVDRQNGEYKPQGGATLETAVITVSSLCDNPIWTLKGTYANGETPTWGKVEAWTGNNRSKKDGVDFLNIVVHKVTKTDGTVQYYASTRDDKGVAGVDFDDGALDITLPYGRYMLREISVDSPDHIYDALTNVNSGYLYDTISQNWRRQFSIGHATNTKHPALTYYSETGSFSTLVQGDAIANPTAIRVTPSDTVVYDPADNHPVSDTQTANSKHGSILDMTATNDAIPNLVARFDIHFIKKDPEGKLLAGAVFAITSKTTGETHIAVTDENGKFDSFPGSNQLTWHTKKAALGTVNGNDEGILSKKSSAGITYLDMSTEGDELSIDYASGVTYTTDEAGKSIVDSSNSKVGNGIWFYGRTDKKTYDAATATGNGAGGVTGNVNEDTRQYISSVRPDDVQTVRNDMGAFPYDDYIIQELPTANTIDYKMVRFEVHMVQATKDAPSDGFKNRTEMELKSPDPILSTTYPEYYERERVDAGTTVDNELPEIHTTLVNEADVPIAAATENYTLIDKVEWYNLQNGHKYKLKGELWMKDENDVPIGTAPIARGEVSFTAQGRNGMTPMSFENLDLTKLGGASLVAYEFLYDDEGGTDSPIAEHKDPTDEGQTVTIPEIGTTLQDSDGDKEVSAYKEVKLIDHVSYKGLKPGQTYTFTGTLHLQNVDAEGNITDGGVATDAAGNPITATKDELINSRNGEIDIEFTFMAPDLGGKKVVAFEECKVLDQLYAAHTEIDDVAQTVYFPEIQTTALDGVTGDHIGLGENEVTLEDVVAYKNLVKGKTYTINGTLMDQGTGEPIQVAGGGNITGSYTFVAGYVKKESGEQASASVADLKAALNKAEGISSVDADELATLSENLSKAFDENKDSLTEEKVIEILDGAKTELGDAVKDVDFDALKAAAKDYFKGLESSGASELVEDENATFEKFDDEITLVSGTVKVPFTMKGDDIRGKAIVVFERLYNSPDTPEEIIPKGEHEVEISKTDAATSEELPGATLTVTDSKDKVVAQWVSGTTPKKIKLDEGTYTLTEVTAPNGYAVAEAITFEVGPDGLVDGEKVEMKDASTDMPDAVAIHEDITDTNQQVNYPEICTMAHVNNEKLDVTAAAEVHLTDVVSYTNLLPGREYVMEGLLMDKNTGQPALTPEGQQITSQTVFTPETASGTVEMEFVFNAHALEFHDVVVFENAYTAKSGVADQRIHVAQHEDINDADQTVGFGEDDIADIPIHATGDDMPFMPLLITIGVAFGAAGAFGLRRRFMK